MPQPARQPAGPARRTPAATGALAPTALPPQRPDMRGAPYAYIAPFFLLFAAFGLFPLIYTAWVVAAPRTSCGADQMMGRPRQLHRPVQQPVLLERAAEHLHHRRHLHRAAAADGAGPGPPAQLQAARARPSSGSRCCMPYATSVAAATLVFAQLFGRDCGMINWAARPRRRRRRSTGSNGNWPSQIAISTIVIWRWTGYNALIYLAGMQAIPDDLYEAAALDGASRWQQFLHVTHPGAAADDPVHRSSCRRSARPSSSASRCCSAAASANGGTDAPVPDARPATCTSRAGQFGQLGRAAADRLGDVPDHRGLGAGQLLLIAPPRRGAP